MKKLLLSLVLGLYAASGWALDLTLSTSAGTTDYAPVILNMVNQIINAGGIGTLTIQPGQYPVLSEIRLKNPAGRERVRVNIVGVPDGSGNRPRLYDTRLAIPPHSFFVFDNLDDFDRRISGSVLNLEFEGNNQPYTASHPWYYNPSYPRVAIQALGTLTMLIENCVIKNQYGSGIEMSNYWDQNKERRVEYPRIRKCQILNCWAWNPGDDTGDGIAMWNCESPEIDSVFIKNDLNVTRWIGRVGIVVEHLTEKAKIVNSTISGYDRNIHVECTYGGHIIQNNKILASKNAITLNEFCGPTLQGPFSNYSYNTIEGNTIEYAQEQEAIGVTRNDFGFISAVRPYKPETEYLRGLRITNNKFKYTINPALDRLRLPNKAVQKRPELYINLRGVPGALVENNTYN